MVQTELILHNCSIIKIDLFNHINRANFSYHLINKPNLDIVIQKSSIKKIINSKDPIFIFKKPSLKIAAA